MTDNIVRGERHWAAKLTPDKVRELRRLYYDVGVCMVCAAKLVGCNRQTAFDAITFRTWQHVEDASTEIEPGRD